MPLLAARFPSDRKAQTHRLMRAINSALMRATQRLDASKAWRLDACKWRRTQ
jgi:hypothetical protein